METAAEEEKFHGIICGHGQSGQGTMTRHDFEDQVLRHLDAAYNLAAWLCKSDHDAQDVVQEACARALRFHGTYRGGDARAWLLAIVRRAAYDWLSRRRPHEPLSEAESDPSPGPETLALDALDAERVRAAIEALPVDAREIVVLRELEGLAYKEIAEVLDVPVGTVMSRLSRARARLERALATCRTEEGP
jgi:RNA polymerase sigma-70 factor (ECF subfamily)